MHRLLPLGSGCSPRLAGGMDLVVRGSGDLDFFRTPVGRRDRTNPMSADGAREARRRSALSASRWLRSAPQRRRSPRRSGDLLGLYRRRSSLRRGAKGLGRSRGWGLAEEPVTGASRIGPARGCGIWLGYRRIGNPCDQDRRGGAGKTCCRA
jgi:hypothetical protein